MDLMKRAVGRRSPYQRRRIDSGVRTIVHGRVMDTYLDCSRIMRHLISRVQATSAKMFYHDDRPTRRDPLP